MAHGLGGVKAGGLHAFAARFQQAGYACLVFDYRCFGDSEGVPREWLDIRRQREDWRAAIACARGLPNADPDKVILWGTSFAGGHVMAVAAGDPRVAAVIAQCPFTDGVASTLAVDPLTSLRITVLALRDQVAAWLGMGPVRVPTVGQPGSVALMNSRDGLAGHNAILQAAGLDHVPTEVPARIALQILLDSPGRQARSIQCPALFCVCDQDTVAPAKATLKHVKSAPKGEVVRYPAGHFDIYVGDGFERNVSDQLAFLARHFGTGH
jgi:pimeloyl-ACP methyl ester carboxylesterase